MYEHLKAQQVHLFYQEYMYKECPGTRPTQIPASSSHWTPQVKHVDTQTDSVVTFHNLDTFNLNLFTRFLVLHTK